MAYEQLRGVLALSPSIITFTTKIVDLCFFFFVSVFMYLDVIIEMASAQLEQLDTSFVDHYDEKCKPSYPFFLYSDQFLCSTFLYNHSITLHFFDSAQK